jgi:hypothetical protein
VIEDVTRTLGSIGPARVAVLAATGPVGQRVARLLIRLEPALEVRIGSRKLDRAEATAQALHTATGKAPVAFATASEPELRRGLEGVDVIVAAGAAGVTLLPRATSEAFGARVLIDLNAVPPLGIEGLEATDRGVERGGTLCWGALGVGGPKMKIHRRAIQALFESNTNVIDAEQCLKIGREL